MPSQEKNGSLRFAVDYRRLNAVTLAAAYPMPRVDSCIDSLGHAQWFTTLDLRSAFWQVKQSDNDAPKTAFITRKGCFQFKRLAFGLTGSPGLFQRLADLIFAGLTWDILLVFLDDIIIFADTVEQHLQRVSLVLERLRLANLKIAPTKCHFFKTSVSFLGFVISGNGVQTNPDKTSAITNWPTPKHTKDVKSFLATLNYYRKHIYNFASIAEPLYSLTRRNTKFVWTAVHNSAFETLKLRLETAPILAIYDPSLPTVIDTDASQTGVGAIISQIVNGNERVIAYASRTLNQAERNYSITKREFLAVIFALKQFRHYILGRSFLLRTDHAPLTNYISMQNTSAQLARWIEQLQEFTFTIQHRPGNLHGNADGLSRMFSDSEQDTTPISVATITQATTSSNEELNVSNSSTDHASSIPLDMVDWHIEQNNDPDIGPIYRALQESDTPPPKSSMNARSAATKHLYNLWPLLTIHENKLCRRFVDTQGNTTRLQLIIPYKYQTQYIRECHTGITGGHLGVKKTMTQLARRAYFQGWRNKLRRCLKQCSECASYHRGKLSHTGCMQSMLVGEPFERIGIDLCGRFPESHDGMSYILTMTDYFSKWTEAIALPDKQATTVADNLINTWICRFGCPLQILSDQGTEFDNKLLKELSSRLGIHKLRTSSYKPSTNGVAERIHRTLNTMMGKVVSDHQRDWTDYLPKIMAAYRSAEHQSTGYSPNMLILGREVNVPLDLMAKLPSDSATLSDTYVEYHLNQFREAYLVTRQNLHASTLTNKKYYDMSVKPASYQPGSWVWYYKPQHKTGTAQKWERYYHGPYRVMQQIGPVNLVLQQKAKSQPFITHVDKVKKYHGDEPSTFDQVEEIPTNEEDDDDDILYLLNDSHLSNDTDEHISNENPNDNQSIDISVQQYCSKRQRKRPAYLADYDLC